MKITSFVVPIVLALAALPAHAGDGVLEINQACIDSGIPCFPNGGSGGFPVSLAAGSYRLTSDIVVPDANTNAIRMDDGATLDLAGFSILGPTTCTGTPPACTGTGTGDGILVTGTNVTIRNGRISGFGRYGIYNYSDGLRVENVTLETNGGGGITAQGGGVQIVGCKANRNGGDGFFTAYVGGAAMFLGNSAVGNVDDGFDVASALMLDNSAHQNGDAGINANYQNTDSALARNVGGGNGTLATDKQVKGGFLFGPNVCGTVVCP